MRLAIEIEYDGSGFCGWQRQRGARSVQECVEQALSRVADHAVTVICAGRTDAGVHACAQVAHFDTHAQRSLRSWILGANSHLPPDVAVRRAQRVADDFHARFDARSRSYRYVILNHMTRPALNRARVCWQHRPLDAPRMHAAARCLIGEHDFSSFRAVACQARHARRSVYQLSVARQDEQVIINIRANAFLHHMVRNIAGVLISIGAGDKPPLWAAEVLAAQDRRLGGVTAPAQGLYLIGVDYGPEYSFPLPDSAALEPGC